VRAQWSVAVVRQCQTRTDWIVAAVVYAVMCACTVVCGSCKAVSNTYEAFLDISLEVKVTECILIFPDRRLKSDNM